MKRVRKNIEKTKRSILLDWKETDPPSYILLAWVLHLFAPQSLLLTLRVCGSCTFFFFKIKTTNRNVPLNIRLISWIFHDTSFLIFHSQSNFPTLGVWTTFGFHVEVTVSGPRTISYLEAASSLRYSILRITPIKYFDKWHVVNNRSVIWMSSLWHDIFGQMRSRPLTWMVEPTTIHVRGSESTQ